MVSIQINSQALLLHWQQVIVGCSYMKVYQVTVQTIELQHPQPLLQHPMSFQQAADRRHTAYCSPIGRLLAQLKPAT